MIYWIVSIQIQGMSINIIDSFIRYLPPSSKPRLSGFHPYSYETNLRHGGGKLGHIGIKQHGWEFNRRDDTSNLCHSGLMC
jgi:hypothetical protein